MSVFIVGMATIGAVIGVLRGIGSIPRVRKRHWWPIHNGAPIMFVGLLAVLELSAVAIVAFILSGICYAVGLAVLAVIR